VLEVFFIQLIFQRDLRSRCDQQCVKAFTATEFNKIFSGGQPRQGVKILQSFRQWRWSTFTPWHGCLPEKILLDAVFADILQHHFI